MKRIVAAMVLVLVGTGWCWSAEFHDHAGATGMAFLKVGIGGRAVAMGGAYSAVSGDATAGYWNPAGLIGIEGRDVVWMHFAWFQGIRGTGPWKRASHGRDQREAPARRGVGASGRPHCGAARNVRRV